MGYLTACEKSRFVENRRSCDIEFLVDEFSKRFGGEISDQDLEALKKIHEGNDSAEQFRSHFKPMKPNEIITFRVVNHYETYYREEVVEAHRISSAFPIGEGIRLRDYQNSLEGLRLAHHNLNINYFFGLLYQYSRHKKYELMFSSYLAEEVVEEIIGRSFFHKKRLGLDGEVFDKKFTAKVKGIIDDVLRKFDEGIEINNPLDWVFKEGSENQK